MSVFRLCYGLACTLVEIFLPLLLLTVCNVCLIRALRRSYRMQVITELPSVMDQGQTDR